MHSQTELTGHESKATRQAVSKKRNSNEFKRQIGYHTQLTEKYNSKLMKWEQKMKYKSTTILL